MQNVEPALATSTQIPASIRPLLSEYLALLDTELPGFVCGFYLQGSIALDAFNEHFSDVDFIAVVSRPSIEHDLERLKIIHQTLEQSYPRWPLEGTYIQWNSNTSANLGRRASEVE